MWGLQFSYDLLQELKWKQDGECVRWLSLHILPFKFWSVDILKYYSLLKRNQARLCIDTNISTVISTHIRPQPFFPNNPSLFRTDQGWIKDKKSSTRSFFKIMTWWNIEKAMFLLVIPALRKSISGKIFCLTKCSNFSDLRWLFLDFALSCNFDAYFTKAVLKVNFLCV